MSAHTPGPWMLATSNSWRRFVSRDGRTVCEPVSYSRTDPHPDLRFPNGGEDGPDARLIAAAPDLLAALQAWVAHLNGEPADNEADALAHEDKLMAASRAAIARATGSAA